MNYHTLTLTRLVWNVSGIFLCGNGLINSVSLPLPLNLYNGGQWQFLTNLALSVSCLSMALTVVLGSIKSLNRNGKLRMSVNILQNVCCNLEFIVTLTYWSIILLFPQMLNGKSFNVSWLLDFQIHLLPYVFLSVDYFVFRNSRDKTISWTTSVSSTLIFLGLYWLFIEINTTYLYNDGITRFPYPFLNETTFIIRIGWMFAFIGLGALNHFIQFYLPNKVRKAHIE